MMNYDLPLGYNQIRQKQNINNELPQIRSIMLNSLGVIIVLVGLSASLDMDVGQNHGLCGPLS